MADINLNIPENSGQTKVQQLIHLITEGIASGKLKMGQILPSVNQMSSDTGFSRDTVFKAYRILKRRNVIESTPTKGYYVASDSSRVFMLLDDFSAFKEQLYQSFRKNLPDSTAVDLLFHHYNREVFRQLVQNSLGRYSTYIIMNIEHKKTDPILEKIDSSRLLVLDMGSQNGPGGYLLQDFHDAVIACLDEGKVNFLKYNELILVYSEKETPHPADTVGAVSTFCSRTGLAFRQISSFDDPGKLQKGQAYFVIRDADLVSLIKACREKNLIPGQDVGILSYNDTPMKQIVGGGISVISTDFGKMGELAALFVNTRRPINRILPTYLILRESL